MPCGSRDGRRGGHRCLRCHKDHVKCDGQRPCASCKTRGVECVSRPSAQNAITIIECGPRRSTSTAIQTVQKKAIQKPLVQASWRYNTVFFQAIGLAPSPMISIFSFGSIGRLSQQNELVSKTVSVVGGVYASRTGKLFLSLDELRQLRKSWEEMRQLITTEMCGARPANYNTVLLCALLLEFAELFVDKSGDSWMRMVRNISEYIRLSGRSTHGQSAFESSLYKYYRSSDTIGAIVSCKDVVLPTTSDCSFLRPEPPTGIELEPGDLDFASDKDLDRLLDILEQWARLQYRALGWTWKSDRINFEDAVSKNSPIPDDQVLDGADLPSHVAAGIEIICTACRLQREIISIILSATSSAQLESAITMMLPYYHWALMGICRLFIHPAWSHLQCELPVLQDDMIQGQALAALSHAEGIISRIDLGSVLYMPLAYLIGLEMTDEVERQRVITFLETIKAKGFDVASGFITELKESWVEMSKTDNRQTGLTALLRSQSQLVIGSQVDGFDIPLRLGDRGSGQQAE
ncbi:uncharacterized protein J3D65DRAFT_140698 [Phyllosticta citribraziliensis]|uniref:Zn(2)-C6 fungal-type domain-containing protein n=1 Tax=Phyllosticta citribraziliensis TaxID=989973 RepID=A0ABR1L6M2_9PEZI